FAAIPCCIPSFHHANEKDRQHKLTVFWSEWRESNSRPLEPHSSALPKLRYTRIWAPPVRSEATNSIILTKGPAVNLFFQISSVSSRRACLSRSSRGFRYWPVKLPATPATCSGVPEAITLPPALPPSGPRSMI